MVVKTPIEINVKITTKSYDKSYKINQHGLFPENPNIYRKLIGKLLHWTITRLDIAISVQNLRQYM